MLVHFTTVPFLTFHAIFVTALSFSFWVFRCTVANSLLKSCNSHCGSQLDRSELSCNSILVPASASAYICVLQPTFAFCLQFCARVLGFTWFCTLLLTSTLAIEHKADLTLWLLNAKRKLRHRRKLRINKKAAQRQYR